MVIFTAIVAAMKTCALVIDASLFFMMAMSVVTGIAKLVPLEEGSYGERIAHVIIQKKQVVSNKYVHTSFSFFGPTRPVG